MVTEQKIISLSMLSDVKMPAKYEWNIDAYIIIALSMYFSTGY